MELYHTSVSPSSRSVRVLAKQLGLELKLIPVDLTEKEHLKPELLKLNPFHTLPILNDDGVIVFESRPIMLHLLRKSNVKSDLYPADLKQRSMVDSMMFWDTGTLLNAFQNYARPVLRFGKHPATDLKEKVRGILKNFDNYLKDKKFVVGEKLTLADICIIHTLSLTEVVEMNLSDYSRVMSFKERVKSALPSYKEINEPELETFKAFFKSRVPSS